MLFVSILVLLDCLSCFVVGVDVFRSEYGDFFYCNYGGCEVCVKGGWGGSEGVNFFVCVGVVCNFLVDLKNFFVCLDVGEVVGVEG